MDVKMSELVKIDCLAIVDSIDKAAPRELQDTIAYCVENSTDFALSASKRNLWRGLLALLRSVRQTSHRKDKP